MGKVKGEDVMLYVQDLINNKCPYPIGCARSITFNMDVDMIETSITGNGSFRSYVPAAKTVTANLEGLVALVQKDSRVISGNIIANIQITMSGTTYSFTIDTPNLCFEDDQDIVVNGGSFDDATYSVADYYTIGGSTVIVIHETFPNNETFNGTISWQLNQFTTEDIYDAAMGNIPLLFEFYETDDAGHYLKKSFSGWFNSITEVASFDNIVTFSADITASGLPTITYGNV